MYFYCSNVVDPRGFNSFTELYAKRRRHSAVMATIIKVSKMPNRKYLVCKILVLIEKVKHFNHINNAIFVFSFADSYTSRYQLVIDKYNF